MPLSFLSIFAKLSPKQWGVVIGVLVVIGALLGSHFAVYKWAKAKAEAQAYAQNLILEQQVRSLEAELKTTSDQNAFDYTTLKEKSDDKIDDLQEKLEHALRTKIDCPRHYNPTEPDPAIGVWNEAIDIEGLPPATDEPFIIDGGTATP